MVLQKGVCKFKMEGSKNARAIRGAKVVVTCLPLSTLGSSLRQTEKGPERFNLWRGVVTL